MKYYITTPIYYVNDAPHIGHAYTSVVADVMARRYRQMGEEVYFLTGTDEHGQKIEKAALQKGVKPLEFCNEVSSKFRALTPDFELSNDDFIRTTEKRHTQGVQAFWQKLEVNGWIYKGEYKGWYSIRDEAFYAENELINGKAPTGAEVTWQEEESYFFKLSSFGEILAKIYEEIPEFVFPEARLNEVKAFVKSGLQDLSISRTSFNWGIPVPSNPKHVVYVWLDALTNYINALGYPEGEKYKNFWEDVEGFKFHIIGKDILRFHAIFWPAFLIAEKFKIGEVDEAKTLELFKNFRVVSHGWWKNNGEKMSKSLGNAINPYDLVNKFGLEKVRYYFIKALNFGGDGDFNEKHFIELTNADLANNIGNLTQRVLSFIYANCEGVIPNSTANTPLFQRDFEAEFNNYFANFEFNKALEVVVEFASICNEFIDKSAPWALKKQGKIQEMNDVLFQLAGSIFRIYKMLECVVPEAALKGLAIFEGKAPQSGNKINKPEPIFARI